MKLRYTIPLIALLATCSSALFGMNHIKSTASQSTLDAKDAAIKESMKVLGDVVPTEKTFDVLIDHWVGYSDATYPMRYLVDDSNFDKTAGPILFYAGNEGDVWTFYNNSGFIT